MTPSEIKNFYKTVLNFSKSTGFTERSFYLWQKKGGIPAGAQAQIEKLTNGFLKFNADDTKKRILIKKIEPDFFIEQIENYKNHEYMITVNKKVGNKNGFVSVETLDDDSNSIEDACKSTIDQLENKKYNK